MSSGKSVKDLENILLAAVRNIDANKGKPPLCGVLPLISARQESSGQRSLSI